MFLRLKKFADGGVTRKLSGSWILTAMLKTEIEVEK